MRREFGEGDGQKTKCRFVAVLYPFFKNKFQNVNEGTF